MHVNFLDIRFFDILCYKQVHQTNCVQNSMKLYVYMITRPAGGFSDVQRLYDEWALCVLAVCKGSVLSLVSLE